MNKLLFKNKYRVESLRLKNWDYSSNGKYFITINTQNSKNYFGKIINKKVILNNIGKIAEKYWKEIPNKFQNAIIDEFIIMPNHIHGIIIINNKNNKKRPSRDEIYRVSKDSKEDSKEGLKERRNECASVQKNSKERCNECASVREEYYDGMGRIIR